MDSKCPNNLNRPHFPGVFSYKCPHKCAAVSARTHTHTHPYIWDFKQRVRKGLVRWPEVIFFATRQRLIIREFNIQLYHDGFSGGNDA